MKYIQPTVKLLDSTIPELGYFTWLKSRQWVITDKEGNNFMTSLSPSRSWMQGVPEEFYVGNELVNLYEYKKRIDKMNLQYNNLDTLIYEITGSCLFRDILFNINKIAQWAQSNRFLFSILNEDARYDEDNYAVSAEYEGIPEWENQFLSYMMAISNDDVVDHNRLEMPYSISSTFWIGINKKTLLDLLSFLKNYSPFFYEVYGVQFNIPESVIPIEPSSAISQYVLKSPEKFEEMSVNIQGTQIVNSKMGLILYSQFIRQADTRVAGLYNEIIHENADEFKHKVFKGGTIINIHYVADITKAMSTVRTRLCAFAMSSGDDPCSWSYFINNFLPEKLSPEVFKSMLPCKFDGCKLIDCKFKDDVKFRNEGMEVSNCPCPIFSKNLSQAKDKKLRDNNRVGDAFYNLTEYLMNEGLNFKYESNKWASDLVIRTNTELGSKLLEEIDSKLNVLEVDYQFKNKSGEFGNLSHKLGKFAEYFPDGDFTCAMKGLAIDIIANMLNSNFVTSYIISFGGDIYVHNADAVINVEGTKFNIEVNHHSDWSIFTSGNTEKRGNHIIGCPENFFNTLVIQWLDVTKYNNLVADIMSTKFAAGEFKNFASLLHQIEYVKLANLHFDYETGKLINPTYCASPFFNPNQIEIRNKMVSRFEDAFRPDLTPESEEYNIKKNYEAVKSVVDANIQGIAESQFLVYPSRTTDLGTLWEVGKALSLDMNLIKYDEVSDSYVFEMTREVRPNIDLNKGRIFLFDCSSKLDVISLGFISNFIDADRIYYQLKGMPDNIMLSVNYHHVEINNQGEFIEYERDKEDEDR